MNEYTVKEQTYLTQIKNRLSELQTYLNENELQTATTINWYEYLAAIRAIQGNLSNDISFVASLMAKDFLSRRFNIGEFDAASKAQGAPGLDIDLVTLDGKRIIGEIKTTVPYSRAKNDLGAAQKATFLKDFEKLNHTQADYKFFFVTDQMTYNVVNQKYRVYIPKVEIALLSAKLFEECK